MGTISTAFSSAFRDYNTDGNSGSGVKQVAKSDCRALGAIIEAYVTAAFAAPLTISANTTAVTSPPDADAGYIYRLIGNGTSANQFMEVDGFGGIPGIRLRRANITSASASAIASGDTIGTFDVLGYGASAYSSGPRAQIRMVATQAWTATAHGVKIVFATTANGSTTLTDRAYIDQDGSFVTIATSVTGGAIRLTGIQYSTATSGTVTLSADTPLLIHEPGSTVSALTIQFPASPQDGQVLRMSFVSAVTTLTWTPSSGTTIAIAPGNPSAGSIYTFVYRTATTKWYRIG